ncbi:MAG: Uma2 family endonuclease [Ferruginibacter sp.]
MPVSVRKYYSEEDFLLLERMSKTRNEYYRGEIFAMSGASYQHNQLASALIADIAAHLKGSECHIFGSDLRVHAWFKSFYTYPDAVIICGEPSFADNQFDTIINPAILFEILSPSTEEYDRTVKFEFYKNIASLQQYVLIDSQKIWIEVFTKQQDDLWVSDVYTNPEKDWVLSSISYVGKVKQLYNGVKFRNV